MKIEIFSIGNELLSGNVLNTNVAFLSKKLEEAGYSVSKQTTLSDSTEEIVKEFEASFSRVDFVISTGGIGPTLDDCTPLAVAQLTDFHSSSLPNTVGSANGILLTRENKRLFVLPGVPQEMEKMFSLSVLPYLQKHWPIKKKLQETLFLFLLNEIEVNPFLEELQAIDSDVKIGIYPHFGYLEITFVAKKESAFPNLLIMKEKCKQKFFSFLYASEDGTIAKAVHDKLIATHKTLSLAESCSGGGIAYHLTRYPGSSEYLMGSVVAYSNQMKESLLHVSKNTLQEKGAVSLETVSEMAQGVLSLTHSDFSIAVSGIAGPTGGSLEKPVGTVCIAIGEKGKGVETHMFSFPGNREIITLFTIHIALALLWKKMK
ncbi:MAG: nicotinamide-nucleotide amidohydrolase family protein [Chlamydiota bacterium]